MKKAFKILAILTITLLCWEGIVNAAVLNSQFISNQIKKDVVKQVNSIIPGKIEVEIRETPYDYSPISYNKSEKIDINTVIDTSHFNPLTIARVTILSNGKKIGFFGVPVRFTVWDKVWVASDFIRNGETLSNTNLTLENKNITLIAENALRENDFPAKSFVRKSFNEGEVLDKRFLESVPVVMKNSPVSVIFQSPYVTVTIEGEALDNGKIGDFVKVKSRTYRREYIGEVISNNTILVNI